MRSASWAAFVTDLSGVRPQRLILRLSKPAEAILGIGLDIIDVSIELTTWVQLVTVTSQKTLTR